MAPADGRRSQQRRRLLWTMKLRWLGLRCMEPTEMQPVAANYQGVYQQTIVAEVTVEESNFMPDATHAIANGEEKMFDSSWSRVNGTDTWKNTITFSEDAVYSLKVSSKDLLDKETSEEVTLRWISMRLQQGIFRLSTVRQRAHGKKFCIWLPLDIMRTKIM